MADGGTTPVFEQASAPKGELVYGQHDEVQKLLQSLHRQREEISRL